MSSRPGPVVFAVEAEVDLDSLTRWLPGMAPAGPASNSDRVLLETFDGRLHRHGLVLWRSRNRTGSTYHLEGPSGPVPAFSHDGPPPAALTADHLPDGVAGTRLREAIGERALLPRARVRSRRVPMRLCDAEGKTVVRLLLEEPVVVVRGQPPVTLARRLHVQPVLGYPRELERALAALRRRLRETDRPVADEAMTAAGLDPAGVSSSVDVRLRPTMRADRATAAICRRLAEVVEVNLPGCLDDTDPEFLHDLRVAVRRTRSVVKEMGDVLSPGDVAAGRADLRWIQEITGPTRDLDVLLMSWPQMASPVPDGMAGDLAPLVELLRRERAEAFAQMRRNLRSRRFSAAWARWRAVVDSGAFDGPAADRPVTELAGRRIVSVYRGMVRMGSVIDDESPPEALHDMRKKGKELRYLLELFGSLWPSERVRPLVATLKGLQDELGHFQDDEIQVAELRSLGPALAATPGGTDSLIALGFVIEGLTVRQHHARADFARRFADFSSPDTRRAVDSFRDRR